MTSADAYARMLATGMPTLTTSEVAALLRTSPTATTMMLTRLARAGLVNKLRAGLWIVGRTQLNRYALAEPLTAPLPSYVSLQTALYLHGMIEQVPSVVYVVSLARTQRIQTTVGVYSIHHLDPDLFDGFETRPGGMKLATPEKALFDIAYFSGGRSRLFVHLPELEMPRGFGRTELAQWVARIDSPRRRAMVTTRLERLLAQAAPLVRNKSATLRPRRVRGAALAQADRKFGLVSEARVVDAVAELSRCGPGRSPSARRRHR